MNAERKKQIEQLQSERNRYIQERKKMQDERHHIIQTAYDPSAYEQYVQRKTAINQIITNYTASIDTLKRTDM